MAGSGFRLRSSSFGGQACPCAIFGWVAVLRRLRLRFKAAARFAARLGWAARFFAAAVADGVDAIFFNALFWSI
jgi:hypothetical protein